MTQATITIEKGSPEWQLLVDSLTVANHTVRIAVSFDQGSDDEHECDACADQTERVGSWQLKVDEWVWQPPTYGAVSVLP